MLTIHRPALGVGLVADGDVRPGHAVAVLGDRIAAVGPAEDLLAEYGARARVRVWDGVLTPGRYEPDAVALLESAYWPDPREADELGTDPLTGDALAALPMTDTRWGHSARRGVQRLLGRGTTVLAGPFTRPAVAAAVTRSGLHVALSPPPPQALRPSGTADFTVRAPDGGCLATALAGRLVFRRR
ncbi:imidazolonepropionase-like domain-containing protein [Streptomyces chilikensis]|uniref:Aminodeoxyfutalosine deaminase/Imidazolonepropionase-like composite domain-containing protein n=1 Tax=Streptomyces chilikensis TaxID=1194079 RepID=A0ABV3EIG8_9ACTN